MISSDGKNNFSLADLLKIRNLVSTLFIAETHSEGNFDLLLREFGLLLDKENEGALALLYNFFKQKAERHLLVGQDFVQIKDLYDNKKEGASMLETAMIKEKNKWINEGIMEGIMKGKLEGKLEEKLEGIMEGKREIVNKLVAQGFNVEDVAKMIGIPKDEIIKLLSPSEN